MATNWSIEAVSSTSWTDEIITKAGSNKNWDALTTANWDEIEDDGFYLSSQQSWTFSDTAVTRDSD